MLVGRQASRTIVDAPQNVYVLSGRAFTTWIFIDAVVTCRQAARRRSFDKMTNPHNSKQARKQARTLEHNTNLAATSPSSPQINHVLTTTLTPHQYQWQGTDQTKQDVVDYPQQPSKPKSPTPMSPIQTLCPAYHLRVAKSDVKLCFPDCVTSLGSTLALTRRL